MFHNEREFTDSVARALEAEGHQVLREVPTRGRQRLDILAIREGTRVGIEVKFTARGLLDDVAKAYQILRLPEVDLMFVCGPLVFMSDNVRAYAERSGVGLVALTDGGALQWLLTGKPLKPPKLLVSGSYPGVVEPGGEVVYNAHVRNEGQKTAVDVRVFMLAAGPFVARPKKNASATRPLLGGGETWEVRLSCTVKRGAQAGKYPLLVSLGASNAPRDDVTPTFEVRRLSSD